MSKFVALIPFPISKPFKTPVYSHSYVISYPLIYLSSRSIPLFYLFNFLRIVNLRISILTRVSLFSKVFFSLSLSLKNSKLFQPLWLPRKQFTYLKSTIKTLGKGVKYD